MEGMKTWENIKLLLKYVSKAYVTHLTWINGYMLMSLLSLLLS